MARNSRHAHWSVSASILARCLPSSFQDASTFLAAECLSSSSKVFYFQGTNMVYFRFYLLYSRQMTKPHIFVVSHSGRAQKPVVVEP